MARLEAKVERLESLVSAKERELSALTRNVGLKVFWETDLNPLWKQIFDNLFQNMLSCT